MFVGIRDIWFARGRFALMTGVIALVGFLVVVLSGLTGGLAADTTSAVAGLDATHIVFADTPDGPSFQSSLVDTESIDTWSAQAGVTAASPLGVSRANLSRDDENVSVSVFATQADSAIAPDGLSSGVLLLSPELASSHDLTDGDAVTIAGQRLEVKTADVEGEFSHQPVVWTSLDTWQELTEAPGRASVIVLDAKPAVDPDAVAGQTVVTRDESFTAIAGFSEEQGSLKLIQAFLMIISAMVVGAFFTVWTIQRKKDLAVLKAMGASTRYLLGDALGQAGIVLTLAAAVGGSIGLGTGLAISGTVPFLTSAATVVYPLILMTAIGLIGAGLAIRTITKVDPLTALGASQ